MITTRTSLRAAGVLSTAGALVLIAAPAMADEHTATVSVLHAVPDLPVDVYANGERLIDDFQPGTLTDPLQLPAGSYDLALFPADAPDGSGDPLLSADGVSVPAGANATVVAHLSADGQPALTPVVNDVSAVPAGQARVTVRHINPPRELAVAPPNVAIIASPATAVAAATLTARTARTAALLGSWITRRAPRVGRSPSTGGFVESNDGSHAGIRRPGLRG